KKVAGWTFSTLYLWFSAEAFYPFVPTSWLITALSTPRTFPSPGVNIFTTSE
ncbi:unnamed protein product, partial [marine sediment metagenome]